MASEQSTPNAAAGSEAQPKTPEELTDFQTRFQSMSQNIIKRIDDMGSRIDELETSIADLMQQAAPAEDADK